MDIKEALDKYFSKSRLPILFAGAGVSVRAGLPDWRSYVSGLGSVASEYDEFTKYFIDDAVAESAYEDAATYYYICRKIPEAVKLNGLVDSLKVFEDTKLAALVNLPFQATVTTNFDRSLFAAYAKCAGKAAREVNIDDPTMDAAAFSEDLYVARVHGRVEVPGSIRLSKDHFVALSSNASYQGFLEHIFTRRQVLFIGFSFLDPAISSVLRAVRSKTLSLHGEEHWALIPNNASAEFIAELELHSIRKVRYSEANGHAALWRGIEDFSKSIRLKPARPMNVRAEPFSIAKEYLATAYARTRIGRQKEPLAQAMAEGIVSGIVAREKDGITERQIVDRLIRDLSMDSETARTLCAQAIAILSRDGICSAMAGGEEVLFVPRAGQSSMFDNAMSRLVDGVVQRYRLREGGEDSAILRVFLGDFFNELLLQRGWELGAAYAGKRMPEDVDIALVIGRLKQDHLNRDQVLRIERSVKDLLLRPDDDEAQLLADLGRVAFGLELLLEAPHDSVSLSRALPERFYFDANVVMPAITPGHPLQTLFAETISALRSSAGNITSGPSLRVYDGFLNEIVSHRRLALESMLSNSGEGSLWEERAVGLFGTSNVNVYVGAYFNYKLSNPGIGFAEFIHRVAPYDNEAQLKVYLESLGFEVIKSANVNQLEKGPILHCLEKYYSSKLEQLRKSPVVIMHDATQLAIINYDVGSGVRSVLVSADRGIRYALEKEGYFRVSNAVLTHVGLTQLVELVIGRLPNIRGVASLLWMSKVSSDAERIRNYLINLALKDYDVALAMNIPDVIDEIVEDAGFELERRNIKLDAETRVEKQEADRIVERYESNFFSQMNRQIAKQKSRPTDS